MKAIYEDRAVAFVDILGFRGLIERDEIHKVRNALKLIQSHVARLEALPRTPIATSAFSDTIVLSSKNDENGLPYLVHVTAALAGELLMRGIFCRGAITSGKLYHTKEMIFGQALIDAYHMEQELAVYPRIIINWPVADNFVRFRNRQLSRRRQSGFGTYFRQDFDHQYHLDVFSPFLFVPDINGTIKDKIVKKVRQYIISEINTSEDIKTQRIMAKLFWLSTYMGYVDEVHGAWHIGNRSKRASRAAKTSNSQT